LNDRVFIKLFSTLGRFARGGKTEFDLEWHPGMTAQDVLDILKIPETVERVILINSRYSEADRPLLPQDTLVLFPPMTGG
jgi:molybdopterin converting factor small subunit